MEKKRSRIKEMHNMKRIFDLDVLVALTGTHQIRRVHYSNFALPKLQINNWDAITFYSEAKGINYPI